MSARLFQQMSGVVRFPAEGRRAGNEAGPSARGAKSGFTILELLAVVVIISLVAGLSVPAIRGLSHSKAMDAATRQLMDDLSLARQIAINSRATVYVVFVPNSVEGYQSGRPGDFIPMTNLYTKVYTSYALYTDRSLGAQPGQTNPRYLTEWKTLPESTFIALSKFNNITALPGPGVLDQDAPFLPKYGLPLPLADSPPASFAMPCIAFNYTGGLVVPATQRPTNRDQVIPMDRGSVFYNLVGNSVVPDVVETPPGNATGIYSYNRIRINWLTGRCKVEVPTFQ